MKEEPGTKEEEGKTAILFTKFDIELPDIKDEYFEQPGRIHQTAGKTILLCNIY